MRSFFSWLMTFVFAFEPFLQVQAAEKMASDQMVEHIKASSLGVKGKTYGDLYMFAKMNLPSRFADRFAELMLNRRNQPLPNVEFSKFKTKEGHDGLKLIISGENSTHTLEILNEDAMFAKLDGVPLTIQDIDAVTPALNKIIARNPNLYNKIAPTGVFKKNGTVVFNPQAYNSMVGTNFLVPTKENWDSLTPIQRARFITELRKTWKASLEVENIVPGPRAFAARKTASLLHPYFLNALLLDEAFAAAPAKGKTVDECAMPVPPAGDKCIHSGYVGLVTNNGGRTNCTHPSELTDAQKNKYPDIAGQRIATCSVRTQKACNPALYGSVREGDKNRTICVEVDASKKPKVGQDVTHWEGACEIASPLDSTAEAKKKGKAGMEPWLAQIDIDPGDVTKEVRDKIRTKMQESTVALDNAAAQLASSLNIEAKEIRAKHFDFDKKDSELKAQMLNTVNTFYVDINSKLAVCKVLYAAGQKSVIDRNPKNANCDFSKQLGACQQLIRRKLVMDSLMSNICPLQIMQIGAPSDKDPLKRPVITANYDDAKLDTLPEGGLDPKKACMSPTDFLPKEAKKDAPKAAEIVPKLTPPPIPKKCELAVINKKYDLKLEDKDCVCINKDDQKEKLAAVQDKDNPDKYTCPEEKSSEINPWIPIGIVAATVGIYALNRDKTKPRLGECPANTKRVGENCYFTPICDTVRYPEVTLINNQCVLPGNCPVGAAKDANGKCLYPAECPSGSERDIATGKCLLPGVCPIGSTRDASGKCVVSCPANTKPLANGTCQWGVMCPYKNQIVYDLAECSEGGGTTTPIPGAGGVQ